MTLAIPVAQPPSKPRLAFADQLRWGVIVLVVSMHAAVTYSHIGGWYYVEQPKPGLFATVVFTTYQAFLQAFFMGLLFLIAGYFVPPALDRKGPRKFVRDRAVRLGVPALLYMAFIQPVIVYWLLREFHDPARPSLAKAYWPYLRSGDVLSGSGPMWFALALLLFSVSYAVARAVRRAPPWKEPDATLPGHRQLVVLILLIGSCTFLVRVVQPIGTSLLNMQLCFFPQYVCLFAVGILARRRHWLPRIPHALGIRWLVAALFGGGVAWFVLVAAVSVNHHEAKIVGGFTWQSAAYGFWEAFVCVGICTGLIVLFRDRFNAQGPITKWLSDNSFAVYMFHPPILIAVTLAMTGLHLPKLVKFPIATALGVAVSYLTASLVLRRIPVLRNLL